MINVEVNPYLSIPVSYTILITRYLTYTTTYHRIRKLLLFIPAPNNKTRSKLKVTKMVFENKNNSDGMDIKQSKSFLTNTLCIELT